MQGNPIPPFDQLDARNGVCVVDGHGIKIYVDRRHLVVSDGIGPHRRERRFHKATTDLRRLIVLGTTGYVSLEAIRWLADADIQLVHLDRTGRLLATSAVLGSNRPALRRAQAWAAVNHTGVEVIRWILRRKLQGQSRIAEGLGHHAPIIRDFADRLGDARSFNELMIIEARAAAEYWKSWADVEVQFATRDANQVPEHWKTFGSRTGGVTGTARMAANPANAILNYLYALLEAETAIACGVVGLDPGIGILHADQHSRDSLALDLMEACRPDVDEWLLDLIDGHHFRAADFNEDRRGSCRITPPLTDRLAESCTRLVSQVAPVVEAAAQLLADTPGVKPDRIPTRLTGVNRSASRPTVATSSKKRLRTSLPPSCAQCGGPRTRGREMCEGCFQEWKKTSLDKITRERHAKLAKLRAEGVDPAHGGSAAIQRGRNVSSQKRMSSEWKRANEHPNRRDFEPIRQALAAVSVGQMSRATGLSAGYCSMIKRGLKTPHPRHWPTIEAVVRQMISEKAREDELASWTLWTR